ncbi:unnamed protein product [Ixodes hexagonus]
MPTQTRPTCAEVVTHNTMPPSAAQQQQHVSTPCWQARMPDMWRTPENRPICFSCGLVGHIARYCRRRNSYSYGPTQQALHRPTFPGGRRKEYYPRRGSRTPSPRRRSISPLRPRTTSPSPERNC